MPTRLLREGILKSERVDELDFAAEVFYRRLMSRVDDHGLYDARPSVLRADCFPLRLDRVREADITRWIAACEKAGLIVLYQSGGKPYLQMLDTNWATRSEPKYPLPTAENTCLQLKTPVPLVVVGDVVEDGGVTPAAPRRAPPPAELLEGVDPQVAKDFLAIRKAKRAPLTQTALDGIVKELPKAGLTLTEALRFCCEKGWQSFKADWYFNAHGSGSGVPREAPRRRKELA